MSAPRDVREDETQEVDNEDQTLRRWRLSPDTRAAILQGHRAQSSAPESQAPVTDHGKVLTDDNEPGASTHIHRHEGGITISRKDHNAGKVERYNFNTGEGFEKSVDDMTPVEAQRRMKSEHTDNNPNPDRDTIEGFHSSVWPESFDEEEG